jgi:hypothetical protein
MNRTFCVTVFAFLFALSAFGQGKTSDAIKKQIRDLKAERVFTLTYDQGSDSTKLMAVAENFAQNEAAQAGTQAINFATAFAFAGKSLAAAPETFNLTFWVLTKKPQFAFAHHWTVTVGKETVDLGDARYVAKGSEDMEYLNFVVSRENLVKIAAAGTRLKLGNADMTFTASQTALLANLVTLSTP